MSEIQEVEDQEIETNEEITETDQPTESEPVRETAAETAKRIHDELSSRGTDQDPEKGTESPEKADPRQLNKKQEEFDPELSPPARLNAKEKEVFNNLPKGLKRAYHRAIRDTEATFTKAQMELVPKLREYQTIDEVVSPFLSEWASQGVSKSQAIAQLVGTHAALKDPNQKVGKFKWLMQNCGIRPEDLLEDGAQHTGATLENDPRYQALLQEVTSLRNQVYPILNNYTQAQEAAEAQAVNGALAEMQAVRDERDAAGRYLYPHLHDADFLNNKARPLVSVLVETTPGLGYGEALRRAHDILVNGRPRDLAQGNQAKPLQRTFNTQSRTITPSPSVRGRSATASAGLVSDIPYVKGESAQETARRIFERMNRG